MKSFSTSLFSLSLFLVFFFQRCRSSEKLHSGSQKSEIHDSIPQIVIDKTFPVDSTGARFTIDTAFIKPGGPLEIRIKYSGGCKEHDFNLYTNKAYMKSMPPQLKLFLIHNSHNDHCRNLVSKTLFFNIADVKYEGQKKLLLILNDYPKKIEYLY